MGWKSLEEMWSIGDYGGVAILSVAFRESYL
jgi:hypothetical protein